MTLFAFFTRERLNPLAWIPFAFLLAWVLMVTPLADDIWWRLASGNRSESCVTVNSTAYRDTGRRWVNHACGYDRLMAAVHRVAGKKGLVFVHVLPLTLLGFFMLRRLRPGHLAWAIFVPPLVILHHALRPYVFSDLLFFLAMFLAVRMHEQQEISRRDLLLSGILFLLWGNLHGAVWIGLPFFWLFAVRFGDLFSRPAAGLKRVAVLVPVTALAALANGTHIHGLVLAVRYATGGFSWLHQLEEWQTAPGAVFLALGAFTAGFFACWRHRRLPLSRLVLLLPLLAAGVLQLRHLPLLVMAAVALWHGTPDPKKSEGDDAGQLWHLPPAAILVAVLLLAVSLAAAWKHGPRLATRRFHPQAFYRQVADRCDLDQPLRVFTLHAWGGAQTFHFSGKLKPFMDARNDCFSRHTFEAYQRITRLSDGWYGELMADQPHGAILPNVHPLSDALRKKGWIPAVRFGGIRFLVTPATGRNLCQRGTSVP